MSTLVVPILRVADALAQHFGLTPDEMPWARDIEVTDPDGNRIRLAERIN